MKERADPGVGREPGRGCPLCGSGSVMPYETVQGREYLRCSVCGLVHMDRSMRLKPADEYRHYRTHRNDPGDLRYRAFLARIHDPLVERLTAGAVGLDYGCGPSPTLSRMLEESGFPTAEYDPFFAPDPAPLLRTYDFVTCSEVAEHFHEAGAEFERIDSLLRSGGWLALMTEPLPDDGRIACWRYARDPTHTSLYSPATLRWIARRFGWSCESPRRTVALFQKPRADRGAQ